MWLWHVAGSQQLFQGKDNCSSLSPQGHTLHFSPATWPDPPIKAERKVGQKGCDQIYFKEKRFMQPHLTIVKAVIFSVVMYGCEIDHKEG